MAKGDLQREKFFEMGMVESRADFQMAKGGRQRHIACKRLLQVENKKEEASKSRGIRTFPVFMKFFGSWFVGG